MAIPEPNLASAAANIYDDLNPKFTAGTIRANVITFWSGLTATFPTSQPNNLPPANWLAVIAGFNDSMSATPQVPTLSQLIVYIYRFICLVDVLHTQNLITAAQANAVLAEFNTAFA